MFYTYNQNNSGGHFRFDKQAGISHIVIVEANNVISANARAESIGLYFDGDGDCSCCGSRWSESYSSDATDTPEVYGIAVVLGQSFEDAHSIEHYSHKWITGPEGFIHYLDGRIEPFWN